MTTRGREWAGVVNSERDYREGVSSIRTGRIDFYDEGGYDKRCGNVRKQQKYRR